jgi:hypothetical protein
MRFTCPDIVDVAIEQYEGEPEHTAGITKADDGTEQESSGSVSA